MEKDWKVGDNCLAPWSEDGKWYDAVIEEIHPNGKVSVGFVGYSHGEVVDAGSLKVQAAGKKSRIPAAAAASSSMGSSSSLKRPLPKETLAER